MYVLIFVLNSGDYKYNLENHSLGISSTIATSQEQLQASSTPFFCGPGGGGRLVMEPVQFCMGGAGCQEPIQGVHISSTSWLLGDGSRTRLLLCWPNMEWNRMW